MTPPTRFYTALSGGMPDQVPTLPKIWLDLAAALTTTRLSDLMQVPGLAMKLVVEAAFQVGADAARLFSFRHRQIKIIDKRLVEVNSQQEVVGPIDEQGGLATQLIDHRSLHLEDPFHMAFLPSWHCPAPLVETLSDVRSMVVPQASFYESVGIGVQQRQQIDSMGDKIALIGNLESPTLAFAVKLRQLDNALMDMMDQPALLHAIMEKGTAMAIERGKFHLACGLRVLRLNDSVANMSVISPQHWKEFVFPYFREVCRSLKDIDPGVLIYTHICGNVLPVMEDIVDTGVDCIGPLDPLGGFTLAQARAVVGKRVSLMGGVNTMSFVNRTPAELMIEAKTCIEQAGLEGGYILGSGCALPRSTTREHLLALKQAATKYGQYACI